MHGSILPELRGSAPVQRSILNHCDEAGVTAMYLSAGMDEGDIIEIRKTVIQPLETSEELMAPPGQDRCAALRRYRPRHRNGTAKRIPQDPSARPTLPCSVRTREPHRLGPARKIYRRSGARPRALARGHGHARRHGIQDLPRGIYRSEDRKSPGALVALTKKGLLVACRGGDVVLVRELQAQGGKRMPAPTTSAATRSRSDYLKASPPTRGTVARRQP